MTMMAKGIPLSTRVPYHADSTNVHEDILKTVTTKLPLTLVIGTCSLCSLGQTAVAADEEQFVFETGAALDRASQAVLSK